MNSFAKIGSLADSVNSQSLQNTQLEIRMDSPRQLATHRKEGRRISSPDCFICIDQVWHSFVHHVVKFAEVEFHCLRELNYLRIRINQIPTHSRFCINDRIG